MTGVLVNNATNQPKILAWREKFLMISLSVLSTKNIDISFTDKSMSINLSTKITYCWDPELARGQHEFPEDI